ncbi:uncharacterized protein LOC135162054 [Diachasmimorpha longicaudata]|uniref:uncharacterized protein LOC135162054 n=1 Tax=Diachasmimorpha longicaudata TaxID=58733 RepID=UPI0030B916CF
MSENLITTAIIKVFDDGHHPELCRALLDTGSSANFITSDLASKLSLKKIKSAIPVGSINENTTISHHFISAVIQSCINDFKRELQFHIVPIISKRTPDQQIPRHLLDIPKNLKLADPDFHKPAAVDLILGSGISLAALSGGQIKLSSTSETDLILQKTVFGWVVGGNVPSKNCQIARCNHLSLLDEVKRFWEIEDGLQSHESDKQDNLCEEHFLNHVTRNEEGRYVVALPFNNKVHQLGCSRKQAEQRLYGLERRFKQNPEFKKQYSAVLEEYLELGHMKKVENEIEEGFYLPHHSVIKETSLTTKVRVVFDASAPSSSKLSLNNVLMVGPTIQDDIFSLILRFRLHNYVLTGDIEKMYRQVLVRPEDHKYQRILWRDNDNQLTAYELQTVTFGIASAPYLAVRCLQQLAEDEQQRYPTASRILKRDLYVDDVLTGAETLQEAMQLRDDLMSLLKCGGFNLRQCASNHPELLQGLPESSVNLQLLHGGDSTLKTLGVRWDFNRDEIIYSVCPIATRIKTTMRTISSDIARIFDPLGLLNPVVVQAKLIKQDLWRLNLNWDESVPKNIETTWQEFARDLPLLNNFAFQRKVLQNSVKELQIHGFCDASQKAYGACIYVRTISNNDQTSSQLFCAKSRVTPLRNPQSIPRLELCAALLLSQLYSTVCKTINTNINRAVFWTDSSTVLHWINTKPELLKTFVKNRVMSIQQKTNARDWRHVRTHENPADAISRGQSPAEFLRNHLWVRGPAWLTRGEKDWPSLPLSFPNQAPEMRIQICLSTIERTSKEHLAELFTRHSSIIKVQKIIARILRWKIKKEDSPRDKFITATEIQQAFIPTMRLIQGKHFKAELTDLKATNSVKSTSPLLQLNPFLDSEGLIRVGGRIQRSDLAFNQKHAILLPKNSAATRLIIEWTHRNCLHAGIQSTLYNIRQRFWLLDGKNQVRHVIKKCHRCIRAKPPDVEYQMGMLPRERVTATRPFYNTGVDYCGPFFIKERRSRNRGRIKVYIAIFVCLSSKAVHIEVASDLTTEAFLAVLRRFISRRGLCSSISSDNGTNFKGACNELRELYQLFNSEGLQKELNNYIAEKGITWYFIPPQAPHVGGIWEAAVKSFKHHFLRVAGNTLLSFEDLTTLATEIEAILNSRPLTPMSSDPNDLSALTPAHFLIGDTFTNLPEPNFIETPSNRLSSWQHIQKLKQDFWNRWHKEYLNELNVRKKWAKGDHQIKTGSIVVIRDDNLPPLKWKLGRVISVHPGEDGIIRSVQLKTASGVYKRNVKKLAVLPVEPSPSDDLPTRLQPTNTAATIDRSSLSTGENVES